MERAADTKRRAWRRFVATATAWRRSPDRDEGVKLGAQEGSPRGNQRGRRRREGGQSLALPAYARPVASEEPIVRRPGEGHTFSLGASEFALLATGEQTGGRFAVSLFSVPADFPGPRPHLHEHTYDAAFVLEGTLVYTTADGVYEAPTGSLVVIPPGVSHTFSNPGSAPARALGLSVPAGLEHYFREIAEAVSSGQRPDAATLAGIAARYDILPAPDHEVFPAR